MYFFLNSFSESRKHPEGSHFCRFYHPCWNDSVFTIIKVKGKNWGLDTYNVFWGFSTQKNNNNHNFRKKSGTAAPYGPKKL